jgi:hypothetical protein
MAYQNLGVLEALQSELPFSFCQMLVDDLGAIQI